MHIFSLIDWMGDWGRPAHESVARRGSRTRRRKKEEERGDDERVREEIGGNNKPKLNRKTVTEIYVD